MKPRDHKTEKRRVNEKRPTNEKGSTNKQKKRPKKTERRRTKETSSRIKRDMHVISPVWDVCCGVHCNTYPKIVLPKRRRKETCVIENKPTTKTD